MKNYNKAPDLSSVIIKSSRERNTTKKLTDAELINMTDRFFGVCDEVEEKVKEKVKEYVRRVP